MIRELTNWVLEKALAECAGWHRAGHFIPVAVNLSAATVHDPELMGAVTAAVSRSGLPPRSIELEITESAVMFDPEGALGSLESLVGLRRQALPRRLRHGLLLALLPAKASRHGCKDRQVLRRALAQ